MRRLPVPLLQLRPNEQHNAPKPNGAQINVFRTSLGGPEQHDGRQPNDDRLLLVTEGTPMKAIPMKGKLIGKKVRGYLWAGSGDAWRRKENYFQVEDDEILSAALFSSLGSFWVRCKGATCEVKSYGPKGRILGTTALTLPHGRK
jgi:hypothetical protein